MTKKNSADTVVVLDFETTGMSPSMGDRPIEVGAVKISQGIIIERFQQLMNPGCFVDSFIEDFTGITNKMLRDAPPCYEVMESFAHFIEGYNLVAHNASFDKRFLDAEFERIGCHYSGLFSCSMLVSRRLYQNAFNHKLHTLVEYKNIPTDGVFHRALADAEMTGLLWVAMLEDIVNQYGIYEVPFSLMNKLSRTPKATVNKLLFEYSIENSN